MCDSRSENSRYGHVTIKPFYVLRHSCSNNVAYSATKNTINVALSNIVRNKSFIYKVLNPNLNAS